MIRAALAALLALALAGPALAIEDEGAIDDEVRARADAKWTGDLDGMIERHLIRVLQRGLVFDAMKQSRTRTGCS